jgi:hypothetical protein
VEGWCGESFVVDVVFGLNIKSNFSGVCFLFSKEETHKKREEEK